MTPPPPATQEDLGHRRVKGAGTVPGLLVGDEHSLRLRRAGYPDSPVVGACLSVTSRCNEACIMCLEERDPERPHDMPLDDAVSLVDTFAGRVPVVNSSASEALLYPHFLDLARAAARGGSHMGVVTNGLALARPGLLEASAAAGLRDVMISCHTAEPEVFGRLTGVPHAFPRFVAALDAIDAHNRSAGPGQSVAVVVEIVLMRPLLRRAEALLSFVEEHLGRSGASLRIETFRPVNAARAHPELQLDLDEVALLAGELAAGAAGRFAVSFRHVPLCLVPNREHLASEVAQTLRREKTIGNAGCHSLELVEQMRAQCALEQLACAETCWHCPLALLCPGVFDIPVRAGSTWPRLPSATLADVTRHLMPSIPEPALAPMVAAARLDRLEGPGAPPRFPDEDLRRLTVTAARLRARGCVVDGTTSRVDISFADPDQGDGVGGVQVAPAAADGPAHRRLGGCHVVYRGRRSSRVDEMITDLSRTLAPGGS